MNKAGKMKKIALFTQNFFKRKGSPDNKRVYYFCLEKIKIEAKKGSLKCDFYIDISKYNNLNIQMIATWLEKEGFLVTLKPRYVGEIIKDIELIEDWKLEVNWR